MSTPENVLKDSFLSSIPLRVGLLFTLFYLVCFTIGAVIFYTHMHSRILDQLDQVLAVRYHNIHRVYEENDLDEAIKLISVTQPNDPQYFGLGYQIISADGEMLTGNLAGFELKEGFYNANGEALGFGATQNYRFFTSELGENTLTLGINNRLLGELRNNSISSFLLTFFITTTLALFGAIFLAYQSQARVRNLARIMGSIGTGNLGERLPVSTRGDDIDKLSSDMNNALSLLQKQVVGMQQVGSNIAHELKTPLSRLNIKIEEAICLIDPEAPAVEKLEVASDEVREINDKFESLLKIAQIEAGARKSKFMATELNSLLLKAYEVYEVVAEDQQQIIEIDLQEKHLPITGDDDLLLQLVVNLIENAIKFCPPGAKILVSGGLTDQKPFIRICDNGPGIARSESDRVFERLYRLEASRTTAGAGLGLSLVKAIAEAHDGLVSLTDNNPGLCVKVVFNPVRSPA